MDNTVVDRDSVKVVPNEVQARMFSQLALDLLDACGVAGDHLRD